MILSCHRVLRLRIVGGERATHRGEKAFHVAVDNYVDQAILIVHMESCLCLEQAQVQSAKSQCTRNSELLVKSPQDIGCRKCSRNVVRS